MREYKKTVILFMAFVVIICVSASGTVSAAESPSANFTSNIINGSAPLTVQFNDTSTGNATSWIWNFGDGGTSTEQNATHTYTNEGKYNVSLTAINAIGNSTMTKKEYIKVYYLPVSSFTASTSWGTVPGAVPAVYNPIQFNDTSKNVPTSWYWDFGDGTNSTEQNPTNTYTSIGTYKVSLTVTNPAGNSTYSSIIQVLGTISVNSNLASGIYNTTKTVTLTSDDHTATIYYSRDTTDPRTSSTRVKYTGPISISKTSTLRYAAVTSIGKWSPLYVQNYVIGSSGTSVNTGLSNYTGPEVNTTLWNYTTGKSISNLGSPVIGSDGTIYVGSDDGKVYALNIDGTVKWIYATGMYNKVGAINSLTIGADGTIYAASGSYDNRLYALNVDGTLKWNYKAPGNIYTPKVGADGTIYLGCTDGKLYAFYPNGTVKWTYDTGTYVYSMSRGPAIGSDGTIYVESVESYSRGGNLYALNPDGTLKWKYTIGGNLHGSPTVGADGTIYVGGADGKLYALNSDGTLKWNSTLGGTIYGAAIGADGTIYVGSTNKNFYALNVDGTVKWNYTTGGYIYAATVGADGTIYVGSSDGKLYAFSPDGTLLWKYTAGGAISGSVAIGANETLYFGSSDKNVYAIANTVCKANQTEGAASLTVQFNASGISPVSWYWDFGDGNHSTEQNPTHTYTNPGYYNVTMTVTSSDGQKRTMSFKQYIKAYYQPVSSFTGSTSWGTVPGVNAAVYNNIQFKDTSSNVPKSWYWDFGDGNHSTDQNPIHVYTTPGTYTVSLTAINPAGNNTYSIIIHVLGTISVNSTLANGTYSTPQKVTLTSDDHTATIYYANDTTDPRTSSTRIKYTGTITINKTTTLRYAAVTSIGKWSPLYVMNYVIGSGGLINSSSPTYQGDNNHTGQSDYTGPQTNTTKWNNSGVSITQDNGVSIGSDGTIYSGSSNGYLYALYPTGVIKWVYYTGGSSQVTTPTIGKDGTIYVAASNYLHAVRTDGTLIWKLYIYSTNMMSPTVGADGTIYVASYDNSGFLETALYAVNPDGSLKWNTTIFNADGRGNIVIGSDGTIYVPGSSLYAVNPDGTIQWTYAFLNHQYTSPSIGPDGTVYILCYGGTTKKVAALYALNPDGTLKWTYKTTTAQFGTAAIGSDGTIYLANAGYLFAINPVNGTQKWNCTTGGSYSSPVIGADGTIYLAASTGLLAINFSNGTVKWSCTNISANGNPVIDSDGTLYVGTSKGLFAFRDVAVKFDYTVGSNPLFVQFNDTSTNATSWSWNFGDGTTSTLQNPAHTYSKSGQYLVTLEALTPEGILTAAQILIISDITPPTVTINPNGGDFNTTQTVTLNATDDSGNLTVYYTTDGSDPQTSSTRHIYTGPITISSTTTLNYAAVDSSGNWSPVYDETYTKSEAVQGVVVYVKDASYYTNGSLNDQIQAILDNAPSGSNVVFLGSEYENLHLVINKQLNLISNVGTKISASDSSAVFLINGTQASGTSIKGFTIINTGSGIVVNNTNNVTISNDQISSTSGTAVLVNGSSNTIIRSSSIHDSVTGISVLGSTGTQINKSNIYNNKDGVNIENSANTSINKNQITGNTENGVSVSKSNKTNITGNTIKKNGKNATNGSGIYLGNSTGINISSNQINENFYGITINNINNATISNNTFLNNDRDGILMNGIVTNTTIVSNTMQKNDNGINVNCASEHLTIRANLITDSQYKVSSQRMYHGSGIFLGENYAGSSTFLVEHNVIRNNANMDFRSCQAAGTYIPGSNWYGSGCKQVTYDAQMTMAILKTGKNEFTVLFYDGVTGKVVTDLPSIAITIMNGAYSQTVMTTNGMAAAVFESLANGDVVGSAYGITVSTAYNSIITALDGSNNGDSDSGKTDNGQGSEGSGSNTGTGGSGTGTGGSGSSSGTGSSASGISSTAGVTAASAAAGSAGSSSQSGSCGDCQSDSKTVQELLVNDMKKSQVWGIVGVVLLIILVLGAYYRKDLMSMIKKSKK